MDGVRHAAFKIAFGALRGISPLIIGVSVICTGCSSTTGTGDASTDGVDVNGLSENGINGLNASRESRFGSGSIPTAEGEGMFRDIPFDYDSTAISDEARHDISFNVEVLKSNPSLLVTLEGHCDERGTADYNLALGAERSRAVRELLASYGVSGDRLETVSYGEELPLDPGHSESAFAKNRRVHLSAHGAGRTTR